MSGGLSVTDISAERVNLSNGTLGHYDLTATIVNESNVAWDFYGARLAYSIASYPDREYDIADLYTDVTEIRPGERMRTRPSTAFMPGNGDGLGRAWWDRESDWGMTAEPRVDGPWRFC